METAMAAVGSVLAKLQAYLSSNLKEDHSGSVNQLSQELGGIHAALLSSASVRAPPGQPFDVPAGAWAGEARELAYDVDDAVDGLLLGTPPVGRGDDGDSLSHTIKGLLQRATDLSDARPKAPSGVSTVAAVDHPRKEQQLPPPPDDEEAGVVGIDDARDGLIRRLRLRDAAGGDDDQVRVISVVGTAGLGKTILARAAYGALRPRFDCAAFVSVGLDPDIRDVLGSALRQLGATVTQEDGDGDAGDGEPRDKGQHISQLRDFLQNKRYLVVLDDLWDKSSWEKIQSALADNNLGSRIIVTTRNLDVTDAIGETYELKPLSQEHSKTLFFRTVFGCGDKRPDDDFIEVSDKILERCGGLPLAIITLAKLLARKNVGDKGEWLKLRESIGSSLEATPEVRNMRMAVSSGYHNLPPHLRACLVYLSIFTENCEIRRDRVIWRWMAEGLVQPAAEDEQVESLFELGQSYFGELVSRGMIQFIDIDFGDDGNREEYCCSVSFPVMDFIRYLSSQENFVALLDGEHRALPSDVPVRRVSIRGGGKKPEDSASPGITSMPPQLRSLTVFSPASAGSIDLKMSEFLHVLDLEGCDLSDSRLLQDHLGSLIHLRYLGLRDTRITGVPEEIGNLKFLQTLDLDENIKVFELPASVTRLRELMCLRVSILTRLPVGFGTLAALEELSDVSTRYSPHLVKELGSLTNLRVLRINPSQGEEEALVESLRGLRKLQTLDVYLAGGGRSEELDVAREGWVPPRCLRDFRAGAMNTGWSPLRTLPPWCSWSTSCGSATWTRSGRCRRSGSCGWSRTPRWRRSMSQAAAAPSRP